MNRVMVDLETLDTGGNAAILSIGAVIFNPLRYDKDFVSEFYRPVSTHLQFSKWRRTKSKKTMDWWALQSPEAKAVFQESAAAQELDVVLAEFAKWYGTANMELWGNGATFDNVILRNAYEAVDMQCPWHHTDDRCYRTLKNLPSSKQDLTLEVKAGVAHNALDDARHQARYAKKWLRALTPEIKL